MGVRQCVYVRSTALQNRAAHMAGGVAAAARLVTDDDLRGFAAARDQFPDRFAAADAEAEDDDMVGELCLDTSHAPFFPCAFEGELIGGADEDEEDGDADRRHDHRLDQPRAVGHRRDVAEASRSEEHTSELQALMRTSNAVFCM